MKKVFKLFFWTFAFIALVFACIRKAEKPFCLFENLFEKIRFAAIEVARAEQGLE